MTFADFFTAVYGYAPFPWQQMLADREQWPSVIDLPTASGKTACLDAAIYRLAMGKTMPRRVWFIVDRRIVVDEAHERAKKIATALVKNAVLEPVAKTLCHFGGTNCPLAVARLRGGAWRDDSGWARDPRQPAIICSTVDQLGSALLFRPYGHGLNTASIYAGLAGNNSLIILDEAHCSEPFRQTLAAIEGFRGAPWCSEPIETPFKFTIMSATLPAREDGDTSPLDVFPSDEERTKALDHEKLHLRTGAVKTTALLEVSNKSDKSDPLVDAAAQRAEHYRQSGCRRIAIMVNRVNTAKEIHKKLGENRDAEIVLLTGRLRPIDRDEIVEKYRPRLMSGSEQVLPKPVILVTTQCLEVGADFSFDALVTECASLDALRQRFGRLDRLGTLKQTNATVLIRQADTKVPNDKDDDPIYGKAIAHAWNWLVSDEVSSPAVEALESVVRRKGKTPAPASTSRSMDFGINSLSDKVSQLRASDEERFKSLLAPRLDAPILLPAHLDLLCQTSPVPAIEPDVSLFLHGKGRHSLEARVVFRLGLDLDNEGQVRESLRLLPPTSREGLSVSLHRLRRWLLDHQAEDFSGDVEGESGEREDDRSERGGPGRMKFILWMSSDHIKIHDNPNHIHPNATVLLSADETTLRTALIDLGQAIEMNQRVDRAEEAQKDAKGRVILRINEANFAALQLGPLAEPLRKLIKEGCEDRSAWETVISDLKDQIGGRANGESQAATDKWLEQALRSLMKGKGFRFFGIGDPIKEAVLIAFDRMPPIEDDLDDEERSTECHSKGQKEALLLSHHTADVRRTALAFATALPGSWATVLDRVAHAHDWGKLDPRFQTVLHGGDETGIDPQNPLAKSAAIHRKSRSPDLPAGWEHAMLSMQIAQHIAYSNDDTELHLIASHHGSARPFASMVDDVNAPAIDLAILNANSISEEQRKALTPACDLASNVANRFWQLVRKHGWWGEAYLEAVFRLADWKASAEPSGGSGPEQTENLVRSKPVDMSSGEALELNGLDGSNPLGFLAALGAFRLIAVQQPAASMTWTWRKGAFRPRLLLHSKHSPEEFCQYLLAAGKSMDRIISSDFLELCANVGPIQKTGKRGWQDKLCFPLSLYRREAAKRLLEANAECCAWLPALGADTSPEWDKDTKQWLARWTRFDFTAANQAFVSMLRAIKARCDQDDLLKTLFIGPNYKPVGMSMRWDPLDEKRQYAVMDANPAPQAQQALTDIGSNYLAIEALPIFPLIPDATSSQPCFTDHGRGLGRLQWALWETPMSLDVARSFLGASSGFQRNVSRFCSNIVMPAGYFRSFTTGRPV